MDISPGARGHSRQENTAHLPAVSCRPALAKQAVPAAITACTHQLSDLCPSSTLLRRCLRVFRAKERLLAETAQTSPIPSWILLNTNPAPSTVPRCRERAEASAWATTVHRHNSAAHTLMQASSLHIVPLRSSTTPPPVHSLADRPCSQHAGRSEALGTGRSPLLPPTMWRTQRRWRALRLDDGCSREAASQRVIFKRPLDNR
jgi:hypothetical protein